MCPEAVQFYRNFRTIVAKENQMACIRFINENRKTISRSRNLSGIILEYINIVKIEFDIENSCR